MPLASLTLAEEEAILIRPGRTVAGRYDADSFADVLVQLEQPSSRAAGRIDAGHRCAGGRPVTSTAVNRFLRAWWPPKSVSGATAITDEQARRLPG